MEPDVVTFPLDVVPGFEDKEVERGWGLIVEDDFKLILDLN